MPSINDIAYTVVSRQDIHLKDIATFEDMNEGRQGGRSTWHASDNGVNKRDKLVTEFVPGFLPEKEPIIVVEIGANGSSHDVADVVKMRESFLKRLANVNDAITYSFLYDSDDDEGQKKKVTVSSADLRETYRSIFEPKGKVVTAKYENVTRFRTLDVLPDAITIRRLLGLPVNLTVPCLVVRFDHKDPAIALRHRIKLCLRENLTKQDGFLAPSQHQTMLAALELAEQGVIQKELRALFKDNNGQKADYTVKLATHQRDSLGVKATDTIVAKVRDGRIKPGIYASMDKTKLKELLDQKAPAYEVDAFITDPKVGKKNAPKMMKKGGIQGIAQKSPIFIVAATALDILTNSKENTGLLHDPRWCAHIEVALDTAIPKVMFEHSDLSTDQVEKLWTSFKTKVVANKSELPD